MSVSGLLKTALRGYLASQPAYSALPVHAPVNGLSDSLASPPLLRPCRLARGPVRHASAVVGGERKGWLLSDF
jgi:hypothetical protein